MWDSGIGDGGKEIYGKDKYQHRFGCGEEDQNFYQLAAAAARRLCWCPLFK